MVENRTLSRDFAEDICGLRYEKLTSVDIEQLKLLIMDYCAVALCGAIQPWGRHMADWAQTFGGRGAALGLGVAERLTASAAAMVNGTCGHGYELDDTHEASLSHPGCVVIAAALATGTERNVPGRDFLVAVAAGFEAMTRIGLAAYGTRMPGNGMHKTSMFGHFGAAAAAGRLMGLDAETLNRAWGVALSLVGGTTQFSLEPHGSMTKRMVGGVPAHNGILAAQIASTGLAAPEQALEGKYGFCNVFGREPDLDRLRKPSDAALEIMNVSLKPYSCCRHFHAVIDALEIATKGFTLPVETIRSIAVHVPPSVVSDKHIVPRPKTVMAAQYSMPYVVGATLAHGPLCYTAYGEEFHDDPAILSLIDRITPVPDAEIAAEAGDRMPARVILTLEDGRTCEAKVLAALGSPENPLGRDSMRRKMQALAEIVGPALDVDGILTAVDGLPDAPDLSELSALLSKLAQGPFGSTGQAAE